MQGADDVEAANHQIHEVVDLGVERLLQLLEGVQLGELAGLGAELLAVDGVDAVMHHQLNALEHVDVADSGTAVGAAGDAGLDAAVDTPVAGLLDGAAGLLHDHGNDELIVEERGGGHTGLDHLQSLLNQILVQTLEVAHGHGGLGGLDTGVRLQAQEGRLVRGILAVWGLATDDDVLPQGIAREGLAVELVAQLHDIGHLDEEALDELDGLVLGDAAGGLVGDIVGVHVLVKAVQGLAVAVVLDVHDDVHEPDELDGLMEGAGGLQRNVRADLGDLKQLSLALLVLLGLGELQSQIAVALGKSAGGVDADDERRSRSRSDSASPGCR